MSATDSPKPLGRVDPPAATPAARPRSTAEGGIAFQALLERLEGRAAELGAEVRGVSGPAELSGALEHAKGSLEDALALGESLLEAYRAALLEERPGR